MMQQGIENCREDAMRKREIRQAKAATKGENTIKKEGGASMADQMNVMMGADKVRWVDTEEGKAA